MIATWANQLMSGVTGIRPTPGFASVTTNNGTSFVTTNGGANRVQVKVP